MNKRLRKYKCNTCGKIIKRVSDKQWLKSYCDSNNKMARAYLIPKLNKRIVSINR